MKKFFMISALLTMVSFAYADNYIKVNTKTEGAPVEVPQGGTGYIEVLYNFDKEDYFANYSFDIYLPQGVTLNTSKIVKGDCHSENHPKNYTINYKEDEGCYSLAIMSNPTTALTGSEGTLVKLAVDVTADLPLNTELDGSIKRVRFAGTDGSTTVFNDITFKLKVDENIVTLDENSTSAPEAAENVNVLVKRSIKPDVWNTICLPFAMTSAQLKEVLGEYQLANFTGYDASFDTDGTSIASIKVNFETVEAIEANHPYIIKVNEAVSYDNGFRVEKVTLAPTEKPVVNCDVTTTVTIPGVGTFPVTTTKQFIGTYVAKTIIPADKLYISNNMFYYSKGGSTLKAFRGYFDFSQVLTDKTVSGGAKLSFSVDGEATTIDGIGQQRIIEGIYDLSGRKIKLEDGDVTKLQKGVYIINGKKVTIK